MMEHSDKSKCFKVDHNRSRLCNIRGMRYKFEAWYCCQAVYQVAKDHRDEWRMGYGFGSEGDILS